MQAWCVEVGVADRVEAAGARVAIDLGQTGARVRLITPAGHHDRTAEGRGPGSDRDATILDLVTCEATRAGVSRVDLVSVGATGEFGRVSDITDLAAALHARWATTGLIVADDAVTTHLGALPNRDFREARSVVASVGTGFVALGIGPFGVARVDGVGAHLGDEGAGWWIGRQGLVAAFSATDGRDGASTALQEAATKHFGAIEGIPRLVSKAPSPIAFVAGFARVVADVARDGDAVAQRIWACAATHIGAGVVAAARKSGNPDRVNYVLAGRIAEAHDLIDDGVEREMIRSGVSGTRCERAGSGLDGADSLARHVAPQRYGALVATSYKRD